MSDKPSDLEVEINAFMKQLPDLLKEHNGEFTVFKNGEPLGFFKDKDAALAAGYKAYGNVPMLVREVSDEYVTYGRLGKPIYMGGSLLRFERHA